MTTTTVSTKRLPATIKPMLARLRRSAFDSPDHLFELKWDGIRVLAFIEGGEVRIQSRNLRNITAQFPELASLPGQVKSDMTVLDGELVCFDQDGRPSFSGIQQRLQRQRPGRGSSNPVHLIAFDLLFLNGESVMEQPLLTRKRLLSDTMDSTDVAQPCEYIVNDGNAFFHATAKHGLEGIMAKEKDSLYYPGKRSPGWHKVKRERVCDFVIAGYTFGGKRKELFSSLLLGLYDTNQQLISVGQVGTGFADREVKRLHAVLQEFHTADSPMENQPKVEKFIYWCRPELVCQVRYGEFTVGGKLRYPVYLSIKDDKSAADCKIEDAPGWPIGLPMG